MNFKKWTALLLAAVMVCAVVCAAPLTAFAAEEATPVTINKVYLKAGTPLFVDNPSGYALQYFVGGEEREGDVFIPTEADYEKWITVKAYDGEEEVSADKAYFSKLPVIYINTDDGADITSKTEYKTASLTIQNNTESSAYLYDGATKIRGRGNSSWRWPKKPYLIKLDKKTDLFGMGKNKKWVLLANYLDESLLRNTTAAQLSHALELETTMDTVWTDVVLNGEYAGNYQLCEKVDIDSERVDIFNWEDEAEDVASAVVKAEKKKGNVLNKDALEDALKENLAWVTSGEFTFDGVTYTVADYYDAEDDISGGFLFELSMEFDEVSRFLTDNGLKVMVKSPEFLYTNEEMMAYVRQYWQDFENALRSEDGYAQTADGSKHYSDLADFDSMVSYWLEMEIMGNQDAGWKSRYVYQDLEKKLVFGPAWDFDYGSGSSAVPYKAWGWLATWGYSQSIFDHFVDDPYFLVRASEKYWQVRPFLQQLVDDGGTLDTEFAYLYESGLADEARWNRTVTWPDKARGFETDVQMFKNFMKNRLAWLDVQFATDEKIVKSTYLAESGAPYTKDDNLAVSFTRAHQDVFSAHAPANGVIGEDASLTVNLYAKDNNTETVNVYVNGLFYQALTLTDKKATFVIDGDTLEDDDNVKNVISLIGKDVSGNTTHRNFATVMRAELPADMVGDVDLNASVNVNDATYLQRSLAEFSDNAGAALLDFADAETLRLCDMNGDGAVNIKDVTAIQRRAAELEF